MKYHLFSNYIPSYFVECKIQYIATGTITELKKIILENEDEPQFWGKEFILVNEQDYTDIKYLYWATNTTGENPVATLKMKDNHSGQPKYFYLDKGFIEVKLTLEVPVGDYCTSIERKICKYLDTNKLICNVFDKHINKENNKILKYSNCLSLCNSAEREFEEKIAKKGEQYGQ